MYAPPQAVPASYRRSLVRGFQHDLAASIQGVAACKWGDQERSISYTTCFSSVNRGRKSASVLSVADCVSIPALVALRSWEAGLGAVSATFQYLLDLESRTLSSLSLGGDCQVAWRRRGISWPRFGSELLRMKLLNKESLAEVSKAVVQRSSGTPLALEDSACFSDVAAATKRLKMPLSRRRRKRPWDVVPAVLPLKKAKEEDDDRELANLLFSTTRPDWSEWTSNVRDHSIGDALDQLPNMLTYSIEGSDLPGAVIRILRLHQQFCVPHVSFAYTAPHPDLRTTYTPPAIGTDSSLASSLRLLLAALNKSVFELNESGLGTPLPLLKSDGTVVKKQEKAKPSVFTFGSGADKVPPTPPKSIGATSAMVPNLNARSLGQHAGTFTAESGLNMATAVAGNRTPTLKKQRSQTSFSSRSDSKNPPPPDAYLRGLDTMYSSFGSTSTLGLDSAIFQALNAPQNVWTPIEDAVLRAAVHAFGTNWDVVRDVMRAHPLTRSRLRSARHCFERHRKMLADRLGKPELLALAKRRKSLGSFVGVRPNPAKSYNVLPAVEGKAKPEVPQQPLAPKPATGFMGLGISISGKTTHNPSVEEGWTPEQERLPTDATASSRHVGTVRDFLRRALRHKSELVPPEDNNGQVVPAVPSHEEAVVVAVKATFRDMDDKAVRSVANSQPMPPIQLVTSRTVRNPQQAASSSAQQVAIVPLRPNSNPYDHRPNPFRSGAPAPLQLGLSRVQKAAMIAARTRPAASATAAALLYSKSRNASPQPVSHCALPLLRPKVQVSCCFVFTLLGL